MRLFQNASITTKLSALTVLAVSASLSLCCAAFVYNDVRTLTKAKLQQIEALAMVLGENTIAAIEFDDRQSATESLASLAKQPSIEFAILYDAHGQVFATYPDNPPNRGGADDPRRYLDVVHPVVHHRRGEAAPRANDLDELLFSTGADRKVGATSEETVTDSNGGAVGKILIRANTNDISTQVATRSMVTGGVLIGSLFIGVGISWYFRRSITVPVNDLVSAARHIAEKKDYSFRASKHGEDELGVLADAFNGMVAELESGREQLQQANDELEQRVELRTAELGRTNAELKREMTERVALQEELMTVSRHAGMAEVATGVLHNVGNVLNSVNVSATLLVEKLQASRVESLVRASDVISARRKDLADFLTIDERGKHFPGLLEELATRLTDEREDQLEELRSLTENIEHVKEIISMQQAYARVRGTTEPLDLLQLVEDALKINDAGLIRQSVRVIRDFGDIPPIATAKHKVLQILVNLISNARHALAGSPGDAKIMTLSVAVDGKGVRIQVRDNGVGIPVDDLTKIFTHGFTTRKEGHGFGLHSSALAAQELGGSLSVHSDGPGQGATFTLRLPIEKTALCKV